MPKKRIAGLIAVLLVQPISNSQQGQSPWCWAASSSSVVFCDYSTYDTCRDANKSNDGTCVRRYDG